MRAVRVEGNFKKHTQTNILCTLSAYKHKILQEICARSSATPLLISLSLFISVRGNKQDALLSLGLQILRQSNLSKHFILTVFLFTSVKKKIIFIFRGLQYNNISKAKLVKVMSMKKSMSVTSCVK